MKSTGWRFWSLFYDVEKKMKVEEEELSLVILSIHDTLGMRWELKLWANDFLSFYVCAFNIFSFYFLNIFLDVGHFLKSLLNLLQYCFCFYDLVFWPQGMWDLSSPSRDWPYPLTGRWSLKPLKHQGSPMCVCVLNFFEKVAVKLKLYTEEYQIKSAHACWLSHTQWKYHPH